MRIWLDDERDPNKPLVQEEFGAEKGMLWVKTAHAAISRLKDGNVEFISLDHDLGPDKACNGADVARWIEQEAFHGRLAPLDWNCHSKNPIGRRDIEAAMRKADAFWHRR